MGIFSNFDGAKKLNIFLGDFLLKETESPTRLDLAKVCMKDMKDNKKAYIDEENSFFNISQVCLDKVIFTKNNLQVKIKSLYEVSKIESDLIKIFSESDKINSIISTNYDAILDEINPTKIVKYLVTDIRDSFENGLEQIKHYKIFGDITKYKDMCISQQDFRKLKNVPLYRNFFNAIREDMSIYPTVILGLDLMDIDLVNTLDFIISGMKEKKIVYATTSSNVLDTRTLERLSGLGIKVLPHSEEAIIKELGEFLADDITFFETRLAQTGETGKKF